MNRYAKGGLLVVLGVLYLTLGIIKWNYIFNFGLVEGGLFLGRYSKEAQLNYNSTFSDPVRYFLFTPKWISTIVFGNLFLLLNLAIIFLVYQKRQYIKFTFWLFFWVSVASFVVLAVGFLTNTFTVLYPIVARMKELQQSPFTLFFLLVAFRLIAKEETPTS